MRRRSESASDRADEEHADLARALEAMTAPELRAALLAVLDELNDAPRRRAADSLLARAAKGSAGWKPSQPSGRIVGDAKSFAAAAKEIGYADPGDVSDYLRRGSRAFLAGQYASSRGVFEALLPPIAVGEIDLGQHELVDEVLTVDTHACVAQYVTSVYTTTPLIGRADAVLEAIQSVEGISSFSNPIQEMENVSAGSLPELIAFLPRWVKRLARHRPAKDEWEKPAERWLREAVFRLDGIDGLKQVAQETKRPQACLAWCEAIADRGDWDQAFRAYKTSSSWIRKSPWRGDFLDGIALAAQRLRRPEVTRHLEAAWRDAPTLTRLLRWLGADGVTASQVVARAKQAVKLCPKTAGRQLGLLYVLAGDFSSAAVVLSKAPGLGWSDQDHPGHVIFPLFAIFLSDVRSGPVATALSDRLESVGQDPMDMGWSDEVPERPKLETPSIIALVDVVRPSGTMPGADRAPMLDAMRVAAEKRVDAILGHSRRRHYGHAALLAATCVALAPKARENELARWLVGLRQTYSRRHAFRDELSKALGNLGVRPIS